MSLSAEFAAAQKEAQFESHVVTRELGRTIDSHERKVVNSELAGMNDFDDFLQPFLRASVSFQRATRFAAKRHHGEHDGIEHRTIGGVKWAIDEDGRRA